MIGEYEETIPARDLNENDHVVWPSGQINRVRAIFRHTLLVRLYLDDDTLPIHLPPDWIVTRWTNNEIEVEIWSYYAEKGWKGIVPIPPHVMVKPDQPNATNEFFFRYFNVVDATDENRMRRIGYKLPSLSTDDTIAWNGHTYRVAAIGFEEIERSAEHG